jgi:hypothetical protein
MNGFALERGVEELEEGFCLRQKKEWDAERMDR